MSNNQQRTELKLEMPRFGPVIVQGYRTSRSKNSIKGSPDISGPLTTIDSQIVRAMRYGLQLEEILKIFPHCGNIAMAKHQDQKSLITEQKSIRTTTGIGSDDQTKGALAWYRLMHLLNDIIIPKL